MIHEMPAAYFTSEISGSSGKRSVVTVPAKRFPVFLHFCRVTASEPVEYCIYNTATPLVPIQESSTEVAGVNYTPGSESNTGDVVLYQSFTGYRADTGFGLFGTPGVEETADSSGVLGGLPRIIPPFCGLAVCTTQTNRALKLIAHGAEIRFSYEIDLLSGFPVPRRVRR